MVNKLRTFFLVLGLALLPVANVAAQLGGQQTSNPTGGAGGGSQLSVAEVIENVQGWVNALIPIAAALALLFFFYQLAMYIIKDGEDKKAAATGMIKGIIALFIIASIWGIVALIGTTLGIGQGGRLDPPGVELDEDPDRPF